MSALEEYHSPAYYGYYYSVLEEAGLISTQGTKEYAKIKHDFVSMFEDVFDIISYERMLSLIAMVHIVDYLEDLDYDSESESDSESEELDIDLVNDTDKCEIIDKVRNQIDSLEIIFKNIDNHIDNHPLLMETPGIRTLMNDLDIVISIICKTDGIMYKERYKHSDPNFEVEQEGVTLY